MLSVFQVFKMVFGVFASIAVLYFLITFAGSYGSSQQDTQRMLIMKNFRSLADDVYTSGNPAVYDLSKIGGGIYFDTSRSPPVISFPSSNQIEITNPLFMRPAGSVSVTRGSMNLGWWKFYFVEAAPTMTVVFNPIERSDAAWEVMRSVAAALPDTSAISTKFTYSFCGYPDAGSISAPVERFEFQRALSLSYQTTDFSLCSAQLSQNQILVTVSSTCAPSPQSGICVNPSGIFYIAGSDKEYKFADGLDIAAAVIGGTSSDIHGIAGENLYNYKQRIFANSLKLAADVTASRAQMLGGKFAGLIADGRIEAGSEPAACASSYALLANSLRMVSSELSKTAPDNAALAADLSAAGSAFSGLVDKGCEVDN